MSAAATVSQGQPYRYAGAEAGDDTLDFVHNRRQTPFGRSGFECNVHSYLQMPCTVRLPPPDADWTSSECRVVKCQLPT